MAATTESPSASAPIGPSTMALGSNGTSRVRGRSGSPRRSRIEKVIVTVVATRAQARKPQWRKLTARAGSTAAALLPSMPWKWGAGDWKWVSGSAADQNTPPPASRVQISTAHQSKNFRLGFASGPPSLRLPRGLMAMPMAIRNRTTTIQSQTPPSRELTKALPSLVKVSARVRSTAATSRKISSGPAPTQRGLSRIQWRGVLAESDMENGLRDGQLCAGGSSRTDQRRVGSHWPVVPGSPRSTGRT